MLRSTERHASGTLLLVEAVGYAVGHLCKAGVEGSIPFVSTILTCGNAG
jgi:hypothetical protein